MGACLRSGYCCKQAPCPFGKPVSLTDRSCAYLGGKSVGKYFCTVYEQILEGMPDNKADVSPAFGSGCCSPMNSERQGIIGEAYARNKSLRIR